MKRYLILSVFVTAMLLPLFANSVEAADGRNKSRKSKPVNCKALKGKSRKTCEAKQAAAAEARRKKEARLAELRRQAEIRRRIAIENGLRKTTKDNILKDNTVGEDPVVRKIAVDALGSNAGTVVVMDTQTGKIKTIVNQEWAIRKAFPPCSTIKLVTTVAGLGEHVIDEEDEDSQEKLEYALAKSSNGYFQKLGSKFDYSKFRRAAAELGLGRPTGINMIGESAGKLPLINKTSQVYSHGYDSRGNNIEITALQQAVMVSSLVNKGKKVIPQVPVKVGDTFKFEPRAETIKLPVKDLEGAIRGMLAGAEYGTARKGVDAELGVAGKTGTCSRTGTYSSFVNSMGNSITVVVILRGDKGKGKYAAAVAGEIYDEFEKVGLITRPVKNVALQPIGGNLK